MNPDSRLWAVLIGGTIGGTLDILFALTFAAVNGMGPITLLQTVASGLLGEAAYSGGVPVAAGVLYPLFGVLLSPMIAALAMSLSSVSVVGNALRLRGARV